MRSAIGLMGRQGYEGTSTRDISNAAGISAAALYYHFPSKLDLLREFLFEAYEVVLERMERDVAAAGESGPARLDAAVSTLIVSNLHSEWAQLASQVALRELGRLDEADRAKVAATRDRMVDVIQAAITAGVKSGDFTTRDTREAALAVLGLCLSVIELYPDMDRPLPSVVELYQRFAVALACTLPAPKPKRKRKPTEPS